MMKDIPNYEGRYMINESGIVINHKGHVMRTAVSNAGYLRTSLMRENPKNKDDRDNVSIHRLVAKTFIPNPDNLPLVMHKDNDKLNNHVSNLKWGTEEENVRQAIEDGLWRPRSSSLETGMVYEVHKDGKFITCDCRSDVSDLIGYSEISLKNMVGNFRQIALGEYKGYLIHRLEINHPEYTCPIKFIE